MDLDSSDNNDNNFISSEDALLIKQEKRILNMSLLGTVIFIAAEAGCALFTGSMAILMDVVYDGVDLVMAVPFLILVPQLYKPVTEKRPYGYSQVESLFIMLKYSVLLLIEIFLVKESIETILSGGNDVEATAIAIFEICVSITCLAMYLFLRKKSKELLTPAIKAEMFLWKLSAASTLGVGCGFVISVIMKRTALAWFSVYVDPIIAITAAVLLAKEPIEMIIDSVKNLILFAPPKEVLDGIEKICHEKCSLYGYKITFLDVIKAGRTYWIEVYFELKSDSIDVSTLKRLDMDLEKALEDAYEDVWLEMIPDVEEFRNVSPAAKPRPREEHIKRIGNIEKKKSEKKEKKNQLV